jgi:hypothetical protein
MAILVGLPQNELAIMGGSITNQHPMATNTNAPKSIKKIFDLLRGISNDCAGVVIFVCEH